MNSVILCGRIVRDPEVVYTQGAKPMAIAKYSLAVNRTFKRDGEPDADFINCTEFGKNAEFCEKYFKKGTKLIVRGHIQTGSYTNRDGHKVYTTDVIVDEHEFAESKSSASASNSIPESAPKNDGFMNIPDSLEAELPFS